MSKKILIIFTIIFVLIISGCRRNTDCDKGQHPNQEWVVVQDSTCTTLGKKNLVCTACEEIITTAIIQYKDHTPEIVSGYAATCTEDGHSESSICSVCKTVILESTILPARGHKYEIDYSNSTQEVITYKCKSCDDTYTIENTSDNLCTAGHKYSDWITTLEPTCESLGSKHKICTVCNVELEISPLPKIEHTEEVIEGVEPSCGQTGKTSGIKCSSCNAILKEQEIIEALEHKYVITNTVPATQGEDGYIEYTCSNCNDTYQTVISSNGNYDPMSPTIIMLSEFGADVTNNNGGVFVNNNEITISLGGEYDVYGGPFAGNIKVSLSQSDSAIINLRGVKIISSTTHPIYIESGDKVEISAKAETENYIIDDRTLTNTTDAVGGGIYSLVDLEIKGKGYLNVKSSYNNGIASTKDLEIKNLTLEVNAPNNALKGNDSLTIESGTITAISSTGDALKTENSDISTKGNQRGIITILDGTLNLYAACDGIDAAYDCVIDGGTININTEKYSKYSGDVSVSSSSVMYLRISSRVSALKNISEFYGMFITENNEKTLVKGVYTSANNKKYYKFNVPTGAVYVKYYAYNSPQSGGSTADPAFETDQLTISSAYDTYYINKVSGTKISGNLENFNSPSGGMGGPGGMGGGPMEGNPDSSLYSCKGIKADNSITINGGTITIKSHDDGIHTNSDVLLTNGNYGIASLTINGGVLDIYSDDDGIHADGTLTVNGGDVTINNSYEGAEGNYIYFVGGTVQIKSLDDAINAKTTLYFNGSNVYLDAGGDGIDSNGNIYMSAGVVLALGPTNGGNGVIDYGDRNCTFSFTDGLLLAVGCSGMNAKPTAGTGNTVSATTPSAPSVNSYLTVTSNGNIVAVIKITKSNQNYRVLAYNNTDYPSTTVSVTSSTDVALTNGLYYIAK